MKTILCVLAVVTLLGLQLEVLVETVEANPDDAEYQIIVCKDGKCAGGKLSQHISATNTTQPIAAAAERLKRRLDNAVQTVSQLSHQRRHEDDSEAEEQEQEDEQQHHASKSKHHSSLEGQTSPHAAVEDSSELDGGEDDSSEEKEDTPSSRRGNSAAYDEHPASRHDVHKKHDDEQPEDVDEEESPQQYSKPPARGDDDRREEEGGSPYSRTPETQYSTEKQYSDTEEDEEPARKRRREEDKEGERSDKEDERSDKEDDSYPPGAAGRAYEPSGPPNKHGDSSDSDDGGGAYERANSKKHNHHRHDRPPGLRDLMTPGYEQRPYHDTPYGHQAARGCEGPPPACSATTTGRLGGPGYFNKRSPHTAKGAAGDYPTEGHDNYEADKCAAAAALYVWPAKCGTFTRLRYQCSGAAYCQRERVSASATAVCTTDGWSVADYCNVCEGPPPTLPHTVWPDTCTDAEVGTSCESVCASNYGGTAPTATCVSKAEGWVVDDGECVALRCSAATLPAVTAAVWDTSCANSVVGTTCTATCTPPTTQTAPIQSTCTLAAGGGSATWSSTTAFCGIVTTEALLEIVGTSADDTCSQDAAVAVKDSVTVFMQAEPDVSNLVVTVTCYNPNGDIGAVARQAPPRNRPRRSSVSSSLVKTRAGAVAPTRPPPLVRHSGRRLLQTTPVIRFAVVVTYSGPTAGPGIALVETATTDLTQVGNLPANVAAATGGGTSHTGSVSGGGDPINPDTDAKLSLLRTGTANNLQTSTEFFLSATFTQGLTTPAGIIVTGPVIVPSGAVTCLPDTASSVTDANGIVKWTCTTGTTPGGPVTISVTAPNQVTGATVSASLSFTIGTDCVGAYVPSGSCSSFCGPGQQTLVFQITTPAANGGRPCAHNAGDTTTEACTGANTCDSDCQTCITTACQDNTAGTSCAGGAGTCSAGLCDVDCVGQFVNPTACSNICGPGTLDKTFQITTPAANNGAPCQYTDGQVVSFSCTGSVTCDPNASCVNTVRDLAGVGLAAAYSCVCNDGFVGDGLTCIATVPVAGTRFYHASCIAPPAVPSEPSAFTGTLRTVGTGGTYATLGAAVAAASAGDRIQVLAGTVTETAEVLIAISLEIFGSGSNCIVRRDSLTAVIKITADDVYIHDLGINNMLVASSDTGGGQSSCITAPTMVEGTNEDGATGIYITRCTFTYPKMGVSIDAFGWVVKDCTFTPNSATPGGTIRAMAAYGSLGSCFIFGNTFTNPAESARMIAIFITSAGPRGAYFTTGHKGNLVIQNNAIATTGGNPRAYIDTTEMFRQPGPKSSLGANGEFSLYIHYNSFPIDYTSSPVLFVVTAVYSGATKIEAFGFFNILSALGNTFGIRTPVATASQKGALFFDALSADAADMGSFATGFFAGNNVFSTTGVSINAAYTNAAVVPNLLVMAASTITGAPPNPLITPPVPLPASGLLVVDDVQLTAGDVVFAEDTCNAVNSGLYVASSSAWGRTPTGVFAAGQDVAGRQVDVQQGSLYGGTSWQCTNTAGAGIVGVNALTFAQLP